MRAELRGKRVRGTFVHAPKRGEIEVLADAVIAIELADVTQWLEGNTADAQALLRPSPVELFEAGPSASMGG